MAEGFITFNYQGEEYQTWYKVMGNFDSCTRTPLVVAHGGPGLSHDYLLPLSDLATKFSVPVIFYDQIGNSRSTHLQSKLPSFWTIDLFINELINLLEHFHIQDRFDLLGHSWGGILGLEFEVRKQPEGLRHLVLTSSSADMGMWNASTGELSKAFPDDVQNGLAVGVADMEVYGQALKAFHKKHGCLMDPWPEELVYSMDQSTSPSADISAAVGMFTGELRTWSIVDRLDRVRVPTFVINGRADIAQDFVVEPLFRGIRQVKWVTMEKSSHTPMWEERERYMDLVNGFLST
ncbi:proline iminopeptidase [Guyanagaster necrorhizus]|uniref:Proline iminopeptidase n=1 Tax=Guyanagaster necrorhizus TaxID=856835 RepID=A0A9P7VFV1_9AGAR|nr:proline iminopeptidase [Guyanagaster necrorhizus MCA 3950]XP_043033686.1 proline iminopeptidase [Guyanagaster necrorhizus MCA 3950]KAG7440176.1 proline iminopeptidase [Guyanagaster necrorhizus MCA 3950]KAG7440186.1 proline iminopeptidase [Guyanagaster necrorhizus MCA 3950]